MPRRPFTTGSNTGGYRLTGVEIDMQLGSGATPPTSYSVKVCEDSSGAPGSACDTLSKPASLWTGINTFTASGAGIDLSRNTTYWLVVDSVSGGSGSVSIRKATSGNEDSGGEAGWSIANGSRDRSRAATSWNAPGATPHKIVVYGYDKDPLLVSNTGQTTDSGGTNIVSSDAAQAFTTGSNTGDYRLTNVEIDMQLGSGATLPTYSVKVCNDSSGAPGATCTDLNNPDSVITGLNIFTASGAGIYLSRNTTYWLVVDSVSGGSGSVSIREAASGSEDSGGAAGWSIADNRQDRSRTATTWNSPRSKPHKIVVYGYAREPLLVSNTGQATGPGGISLAQFDAAQAFTTGTNIGVYRLTGVEIEMQFGSGVNPAAWLYSQGLQRFQWPAGSHLYGLEQAGLADNRDQRVHRRRRHRPEQEHHLLAGVRHGERWHRGFSAHTGCRLRRRGLRRGGGLEHRKRKPGAPKTHHDVAVLSHASLQDRGHRLRHGPDTGEQHRTSERRCRCEHQRK